jgi:hypothetical protein
MRILFYTGGTKGSGHIVLGLSLASAFKRAAIDVDYAILSVETPFAELARRLGTAVSTIPCEDAAELGGDECRESALFSAIRDYRPDILVVDQFWFAPEAFIRELPCRKVLLLRQVDPRFFHFYIPQGERRFRPDDWDLILKTEPGFALPFEARQIQPIVIRNRDEIMSRETALRDLGLKADEQHCLFAFNGNSWEGEEAWKSFSYLQDEGWTVIRSDNRTGGLFPAVDWFAAFELLVCGAGYSAFWEARWLQKEAFFVPFPRQFEDQNRRIACCSDYTFDTNGADELVRMLSGL